MRNKKLTDALGVHAVPCPRLCARPLRRPIQDKPVVAGELHDGAGQWTAAILGAIPRRLEEATRDHCKWKINKAESTDVPHKWA